MRRPFLAVILAIAILVPLGSGSALAQRPAGPGLAPDRERFLVGLVATSAAGRRVTLVWPVEAGAERYHVLRGARLFGPWVDLTPRGVRATSFETQGAPGIAMVFRVVASRAHERPDTTSAAYVTPERRVAVGPHVLACTAHAPSSLRAAWSRDPEADLYAVELYNDAPPAPNRIAAVRTRDTTFAQSGLPAGRTLLRVRALYTLADFPATGDTSVFTSEAPAGESADVTFPITRSRACACGPRPASFQQTEPPCDTSR